MSNIFENHPIREETVISRVVNGEAVLVIPQEGQVKVLNEVGSRIWALADGTRSVRQIAKVICEEYDVDEEQSENDVRVFFEQLLEKELVTLAESPNQK